MRNANSDRPAFLINKVCQGHAGSYFFSFFFFLYRVAAQNSLTRAVHHRLFGSVIFYYSRVNSLAR